MTTYRLLALVSVFAMVACSETHDENVAAADGGTDAPLEDAPLDAADATVLVDAGPIECVTPQVELARCTAAMCGDGVIDDCPRCYPLGGPAGGDGGVSCSPQSEDCDGANLNGATCASLGYAGGALACSGACGFDTSACYGCAADSHLAACAALDVASDSAFDVALVSREGTLAVAWLTSSSPSGYNDSRVHLAELNADLSVSHDFGCLAVPSNQGLALAATSRGYLLGTDASDGVHITEVLLDGTLARSRVIADARWPHFAPRPDALPLLVYANGDHGIPSSAHAELLNADLSAAWTTQVFAGDHLDPQFGAAVSTGDGFLVAYRSGPVMVARIELDGSLTGTSQPGGSDTERPSLAWTGSEARIVFMDFSVSPGIEWARLDRLGARIGAVASVPHYGVYAVHTSLLALGTESAVLVPSEGTSEANNLSLARLDADGVSIGAPIALSQDAAGAAASSAVMIGSQLAVAWVSTALTVASGTGEASRYAPRLSVALVNP